MMTIIKINSTFIRISYVIISIVMLLSSCSKDKPIPPQPGPFNVTHDIPTTIPVSGGTYILTIDATTNGWWIVKSENVSWLTINRVYGSAKVSQQIIIAENKSSVERELSIEIKSTNQESSIIKIKQDK